MVKPTMGVEMKLALLSLITTNQLVGLDNEDPLESSNNLI